MEEKAREELKRKIIDETKGKLSEEQINKILDSVPYDTEIEVTSNPYDLSEMSIEISRYDQIAGDGFYETNQKVNVVDGDINIGFEKGDTFSGIAGYREDIEKEEPDFTLNKLQIVNTHRTEDIETGKEITNKTYIYIPDKEYPEGKTYKELLEEKAREEELKENDKKIDKLDELDKLREQKKKLKQQEKSISETEKLIEQIETKEDKGPNIDD